MIHALYDIDAKNPQLFHLVNNKIQEIVNMVKVQLLFVVYHHVLKIIQLMDKQLVNHDVLFFLLIFLILLTIGLGCSLGTFSKSFSSSSLVNGIDGGISSGNDSS